VATSDLPERNPHGLPALLPSADPSDDGTGAALLALMLTTNRLMMLALTEQGRTTILAVRQALFQRVEWARQKLSPEEQDAVRQAVPALRRLFQLA
jgi:hypothetical protein